MAFTPLQTVSSRSDSITRVPSVVRYWNWTLSPCGLSDILRVWFVIGTFDIGMNRSTKWAKMYFYVLVFFLL